jgi:hypothetical protein
MDVDDSTGVERNDVRRNKTHVPGENHEVHTMVREKLAERRRRWILRRRMWRAGDVSPRGTL